MTAAWPALPLEDWKDTYHTLHMWTQMVGKVRVALATPTNHLWDTVLYLTARGLTTSPMRYGSEAVEIAFDFVDHTLRIDLSNGGRREIALAPQSVARFYDRFTTALRDLGIDVHIWPMPVEVEAPVRFTEDESGAYDAEAAHRCWRVFLAAHSVLKQFRARFIGKCSPVHFFWGGFDLAVTRFSGRVAPPRPGAGRIDREAYSHEVASVGFWPGSGPIRGAAFYSYAAPEPSGFAAVAVRPAGAFYSADMKEFFYMYDDMRAAPDPEAALLEFAQSAYDAAANLGQWDRRALERPTPASSA
jgi:hypothetical protein